MTKYNYRTSAVNKVSFLQPFKILGTFTNDLYCRKSKKCLLNDFCWAVSATKHSLTTQRPSSMVHIQKYVNIKQFILQ